MSEDYSLTPRTPCPKGNLHRGKILGKCEKCGKVLLYEDYEIRKAPIVTSIKCIECGAMREIKPQDAHQVTRCKDCQRKRKSKLLKRFLEKQGGMKCL